jgi:hypothetical protein
VNDGKQDAWSFVAADGTIARTEISTGRDGAITRIEYFEGNHLVRVEEDTDRDGRIDKWETYDGNRLASVAFDTVRRGTPDRRLIYGADGSARMEIDEAGDGHFMVLNESGRVSPPANPKRRPTPRFPNPE